ncbi:MAG: PhoX family phosphatase [Acidimicrobiales bacterium]|nr:PhoX family phosphatase [Acidimicrobiales bacterium]
MFEQDLMEASDVDAPHLLDVAAGVSRRRVLGGGLAAAAAFLVGGRSASASAVAGDGSAARGKGSLGLLGFAAIPPGFGDEVVVPEGYTARPFLPWGTPILGSYPAYVPGTPPLVPGGNTAADQAQQMGSDHDGMHYFPLARGQRGSEHGLLVMNHEAVQESYLHTGTTTAPTRAQYTADMVRKSQNAHGVAVVEVRRAAGGEWEVVRGGYNRRITAYTPMTMSGPAAGHRLLRTSADPEGRSPLGTFNNCAHGYTPWGTYLTCEENFNGYFRVDPGAYDAEHQALNAEYGVGGDRNSWSTHDPRFVVTPGDPNEPNRFGWVVEIDPFDPTSTPVKRTALGRTKHEGAFVQTSRGGRVVVYLGDDQVNEYVYKFVSSGNAPSMRARGISPLDEGTLYVARFDEDGTGIWLPLVHGQGPLQAANGFADQGDVLVKTRLAANAVKATPMDRPEWTAVDPVTGLVYLTLTNNTDGGKTVNAANPRKPNPWGHIVRWEEAGGDHTATSFTWDLFVLAGPGAGVDGSSVDAEDAFGSPDGLWADPDGRVWIQTDGRQPSGANNQMLAADPGSRHAAGRPELRRFLTGVIGSECTGVVTTPDQRTMFTNIQHPGENGGSTWPPQDGLTTPRSATVIVTKDDGGAVGS